MDLHSTDELLGMIEALDRPRAALLELFFPSEQVFDTEEVHLDKLNTARRLAPFVTPTVAGRAEPSRGYRTLTFKPPYVKPKHTVEPNRTLKRRAGEKLTGEMSPEERRNQIVVDNLRQEEEEIVRREEWMASEILRTGTLTCKGPDFPELILDFERDPSLTKVLAGAARWGEVGVVPTDDIRTWTNEVHKLAGAHPGTIIMDPLAANYLVKDPELRVILDNRRQMGGEAQLAGVSTGAQGEELAYLGSVGQWEYWQYSAVYTDEAGVVQNFMPDYTVIGGSKSLSEGIRTYGAIMDHGSLKPMSRFPKEWDEQDPSVRYTMTQSAPLPVLGRPDATFCVTVR